MRRTMTPALLAIREATQEPLATIFDVYSKEVATNPA